MKEIDWAKLFDCAVFVLDYALFAILIIMYFIVTSILIVSVIYLIGIFGYEWLVLIGIIVLLFIGLTYCAYKYDIT